MKKTVLLLLLALAAPLSTTFAQNIALGQRVPELKVAAWLGGRQPAPAQATYIEFFHSSNPGCAESLERLREMTNKFGTKLRVVVLAREPEEKVAPLLSPYLSPRIGVALDPSGRIFSAFGVSYVPFGVLVDAKNRALWMGNSLQLTPKIIEDSTK